MKPMNQPFGTLRVSMRSEQCKLQCKLKMHLHCQKSTIYLWQSMVSRSPSASQCKGYNPGVRAHIRAHIRAHEPTVGIHALSCTFLRENLIFSLVDSECKLKTLLHCLGEARPHG